MIAGVIFVGSELLAVQPGSVAGWLTFVGVVGAAATAFLVYRGGGGGALGTLVTANGVLQRHADALEKRVDELERAAVEDRATIAKLQAETNVALAIQPLVDSMLRHDEKAELRAREASERHARTLEVLTQISTTMTQAKAA